MNLKGIRVIFLALFLAVFMLFSGSLQAKPSVALFEPANFVLIRGGEFTMGSPVDEAGRAEVIAFWAKKGIPYSESGHQVRLSNFYMSRYAVSVAEFRRFVEASGYRTEAEKEDFSVIVTNGEIKKGTGVNWRHGVSGSLRPQSEENHPVLHVSWNDVVEYCKWLSKKTGKIFRLPTEAEWEYACRAGSETAFNTGINLKADQANFTNEHGLLRSGTVPVNSFAPNAWGLYNMHGNVWEWCSDQFGGTYYEDCNAKGIVTNPAGPAMGSYRVIRGGSWTGTAGRCRSAARSGNLPSTRGGGIGFRLVLMP